MTTRYVGPGDGVYAAFQPGAAIAVGYDDSKVIEAQRFLQSIKSGQPVGTTIWDAVSAAQLIEAISEPSGTGRWERPQTVER